METFTKSPVIPWDFSLQCIACPKNNCSGKVESADEIKLNQNEFGGADS
jgi:hypothetical protein